MKECNSSKQLHVFYTIHIPFLCHFRAVFIKFRVTHKCESICGALSSLVTERRVATFANAVCLTNYSYIFTHNVTEVRRLHQTCHFLLQISLSFQERVQELSKKQFTEISVACIQPIVGTFSNVSLDSFFKIEQDYL